MSDLTLTEKKHVRTALRYLRRKLGAWVPVAEALHLAPRTVKNLSQGGNNITASTAFRVARLLDCGVDDLIAGRFLPGACPRCGYAPDFAEDEETVVESRPRPEPGGGLKVVK